MAPLKNRGKSIFACALLALSLAGCQLAALAAGNGSQDALYKINKKQHVAVLVDVAETVTPPPTFPTTLADKIGAHLVKYRATEFLVPQGSIVDLQQRDPAQFKAMSIAQIARAVGADAVIVVRLTELDVARSEEKSVTEGFAEAYVKVVDRDGNRLYPGDEAGTKISSHIPAGLTSEQDTPALQKKMLDQLSVLTGRMFHAYSNDDKDMIINIEDRKLIGN